MANSKIAPSKNGAGLATLGCVWLLSTLNASSGLVSTFQAGDSGWHLGSMAVGQLDGSPDLEIIVPYRDSTGSWFLDAFKYTGQRVPGFSYSSGGEGMNGSPTICDLHHQGLDAIIFMSGKHLIVL